MNAHASALAIACLLLAAPAATAAEATGAAPDLVQRECSTCHGLHGISTAPTFPNLAAQPAAYLEAQLKAFRDHSRADPHAQAFMWGMAAQLTDAKIKEIAEYFSKQPPAPGTSADPAEVAAGRQIFENGIDAQGVPACMACHGDKAQGNEVFPRLAGQHRSYIEKQLEAFASNLRENEIMHQNATKLTARQISDVAAFLSSM